MRAYPWALALSLTVVAGCQQLNPDQGRFSCATTTDCGKDFECRQQFDGGGRCFKLGECVDAETCNGADDDCDGRTDETFPEKGQACPTGVPGACANGQKVCTTGAIACAQTVMPTAELCNLVDDDCDGMTDETFDFTSDEQNCGGCSRRCDAGTTCQSSSCQETTCDDGFDNDNDGRTDCLDDSCLGLECVTPAPPSWRCGVIARDAGVTDGGADAGSSDGGADAGGPFTFGCFAPESDCANGLDDDGDGMADCLDLDCDQLTCASGTRCTNLTCPGPG